MAKLACLVGLLLLAPMAASAGTVSVRFEGGYVTVTAQNAPVRDILAEWARQGQTRVVNAEKIPGGLVTLELRRVPEKQALEVLLRAAAGYVAAPRGPQSVGASTYDRILIMATSTAAPPPPASAVRPGGPPVFTPPAAPPVAIDEEQEEAPVMVGNPGGMLEDEDEQPAPPYQVPQAPQEQPVPVDPNAPAQPTPTVPGPTPLPQGVVTQPAPGQIPVPQQQPKPTP